jgi:hypothetical protein
MHEQPSSHFTGTAPVPDRLHFPPVQVWPDMHARPQAPQFASSVPRSTHFPLQQVSPVLQACPHAPQFDPSAWRLTQMKFLGEVFEVGEKESRLHAVKPVLQTQVPPWQVEPAGQA